MYPKDYLEIIYEICKKYSISITSFENTSVLCLSHKKEQHFIWSRRFDLNSAIASRLADNKYETSVVLQSCGIPVVECYKLSRIGTEEYISTPDSNLCICRKLLSQYGIIVVKPNNSYEGKNVYRCSTMKDVEMAFHSIYSSHKFIVVTPYINAINEYRAFFLNGTILLIYKKDLPYIIADGKSTLMELLVAQSYDYKMINHQLYKELNRIYPVGQKIILNWKFNLTQGASCQIIESSDLYSRLCSLAIKSANAIGISFATVDIIEEENGNLIVLEINAGVAMDQFIQQVPSGRNIATNIYEKAILSMFHLE
jgi:glutathione synthase/RimK-type ligase-like ATP-grasp enzyme